MALEYSWSADADVDVATLRDFIATATGGEQHPDGTVFLDGMYVMAAVESGDDVNPSISQFGFDERISATFRFSNRAGEATTDHNVALMVHVLIAFAQSHGDSGVLLFNGEHAVLRYGEDGIIFDSEWEDWQENGEVAPLLGQFATRVLPQPLL